MVPPTLAIGVAAIHDHGGHDGHDHDLANREAEVRLLGKCPDGYSFRMVD